MEVRESTCGEAVEVRESGCSEAVEVRDGGCGEAEVREFAMTVLEVVGREEEVRAISNSEARIFETEEMPWSECPFRWSQAVVQVSRW